MLSSCLICFSVQLKHNLNVFFASPSLLQPSLGGNAKTFIIVNVSASASHTRETIHSLEFGQLAKRVTTHASVNWRIRWVVRNPIKS